MVGFAGLITFVCDGTVAYKFTVVLVILFEYTVWFTFTLRICNESSSSIV